MRKNTEQIERPSLPGWMTGRPGQIAGAAAIIMLLACAGERRAYDPSEGARSVAAGIDVYDGSGSLAACANTTEATTATPVGADVKEGNVGGLQDGQVMRYEFAEGDLPLSGGNDCEGTVWVHANQAPAA